MAEAFGVRKERIRSADPSAMPTLYKIIQEEMAANEPSIIITNRPCTLIDCFHKSPPFKVDEDACTGCANCLNVGCPAISVTRTVTETTKKGNERLRKVRHHRQRRLHRLQSMSQHLRSEGHRARPRRGRRSRSGSLTMTELKANLTNIMVVGMGGQGVMTASEILAQAALGLGYDVKKTEVAGMAQRGGVVASHLRFGDRVLSSAIGKGEAHILVGFEPAEAYRWSSYLRPDGVAMVNTLRMEPPVVSMGLFDYPDDPIADMRANGITVFDFDAGAIARELGEMRLVNTIMLGAIADHLPFPADALKNIIVERFRAKKPALADLNAKAFGAGREAASLVEDIPA